VTEHPDRATPTPSSGGTGPRITLSTIDQFIFGLGMFVSMFAIVVGVVTVVDSKGSFPYVLIGGVVLGIASLWYLQRRYKAMRIGRGLSATADTDDRGAGELIETRDPDNRDPDDWDNETPAGNSDADAETSHELADPPHE
jgi:hypothetical protein